MTRSVALAVFYTQDKRILLQDRHSISKAGEEWGWFGGGLEPGETPEQALIREIKEELTIDIVDPKPIGQDKIEFTDPSGHHWQVSRNFFAVPLEPYQDAFDQKEGNAMCLYTLNEAENLTLFIPKNPKDPFLPKIKSFLEML